MTQSIPYGLWPSPLTPSRLAGAKRLQDVAWSGESGLVWLEGRSGQGVLVHDPCDGDAPRDVGGDLSVRARVGYGGGDMSARNGVVYFASQGRLYRQSLCDGAPQSITPAFGDAASPTLSPDGKWVLFVHTYEEQDVLAIVDSEGENWPQRIVSGQDFYMQPAWHPSGERIAWICWNHPNMPWDGTKLMMGTVARDDAMPTVANTEVIAGDDDTSIFQPAFSPDGRYLAYVSDTSGWYNLYLYDLRTNQHSHLVQDEAELAMPAWVQGIRTYCWAPDNSAIYYAQSKDSRSQLWKVDIATGETSPVAALSEYTDVSQPAISPSGDLACIVSNASTPSRVVIVDAERQKLRIVARSQSEGISASALSQPEAITWTSAEGDDVHGLLYMPPTGQFTSPGKPPLIVRVHGGPTGQSDSGYDVQTQYLASRGYAVLQVNYRGSAGYGRRYRNLLREQWGIYDTDDAVTGVEHLSNKGLVDGSKAVVMGGSAGGYLVLQALVRYPGVFKAGVCLYGVTNLFTLASDTHKFEQRYLDSMIGPLPETAKRYHDRSPIFFADRIVDPIYVFQGEIDRVVPKDQAETIVAALKANGVPHEYTVYEGEGHGWRKSETIKHFSQALERFLKQYVLFA